MKPLPHEDRARAVQRMFDRIAPRYDLMNRLMTAGQDVRWRREVVRRARLQAGMRVLDLGAGTGDLSFEVLRQHPQVQPVAADFTLGMLHIAQRRAGARPVVWSAADALHLPFPDEAFDAVISGFLLRNVTDLPRALREMRRVLRPGGRFVALDTTRPARNWLYPFIAFHLHTVIPWLGRLIAGQAEAYTYLPQSTEGFLRAEELAAHMAAAGFRQIGFRRRMFGTIAIHWGEK